MARPKAAHPTDAELEILAVLWDHGPAGLGAIYDAVRARRPVARTTVATMLGVMLDKGLVRRHESPAGYAWTAAVDRDAAARGMMAKLIDALFGGSALRVVTHLVDDGRLSPAQMAQLRALLEQADNAKPAKHPRNGGAP